MASDIDILVRAKDEASKVLRDVATSGQLTKERIQELGESRKGLAELRKSALELDKAEKAIHGVGDASGSTLGKLGSLAKSAPLMLGAVGLAGTGVTAAFVGVVKSAADFEQSLANTKAATGATADQMAAMRKEALGIGKDTSKSASDAAAAMGELVKAGVPVEKVINGVARSAVQLAEATGVDVPFAANLMSKAINTFQKDNLTGAEAAEMFAKAANASAINVTDMGYSLAAVGPVAAASGLSMKDFATAIGIMGNNALVGSDAGTSLKAFIAGLTPNSKEAKAAMRDLGFSAFDAAGNFKSMSEIVANLQRSFGGMTEKQRATTAELLFGSDGIRAMNILLKEGTAGWDAFQGAMAGAPSLAEQSATRMETLNGRIESLKGSLETIAINIGSMVLPALTKLAELGVAGLNAIIEQGVPWLEQFKGDLDAIFAAAQQVASDALKVLSGEMDTLIPKILDAAGNAAKLALELGAIVLKAGELTTTLQGLGGESDNTSRSVDAMFGSFGALLDVFNALTGVLIEVIKWLGEQQIVIDTLARGMDRFVERMFPGLHILEAFVDVLPLVRKEFEQLKSTLDNIHPPNLNIPNIELPRITRPSLPSLPQPNWEIDVPWFATGGIVRKKSLIGVGEAGPEAVVPLSNGGIIDYDRLARAIAGQPITINIDGQLIAQVVRSQNSKIAFRNVNYANGLADTGY